MTGVTFPAAISSCRTVRSSLLGFARNVTSFWLVNRENTSIWIKRVRIAIPPPVAGAPISTYYVLFFIHLESRRVSIAGITHHPHEYWMQQIARNATLEEWGYLNRCRYVLHDRDTKFCASFRDILAAGGVKPLALPARRY